MSSFTKEVNLRVAKHPLVFNWRLANRELTSLLTNKQEWESKKKRNKKKHMAKKNIWQELICIILVIQWIFFFIDLSIKKYQRHKNWLDAKIGSKQLSKKIWTSISDQLFCHQSLMHWIATIVFHLKFSCFKFWFCKYSGPKHGVCSALIQY